MCACFTGLSLDNSATSIRISELNTDIMCSGNENDRDSLVGFFGGGSKHQHQQLSLLGVTGSMLCWESCVSYKRSYIAYISCAKACCLLTSKRTRSRKFRAFGCVASVTLSHRPTLQHRSAHQPVQLGHLRFYLTNTHCMTPGRSSYTAGLRACVLLAEPSRRTGPPRLQSPRLPEQSVCTPSALR